MKSKLNKNISHEPEVKMVALGEYVYIFEKDSKGKYRIIYRSRLED